MKINKIRPLEHIFTKRLKTLALIPKMLYFYGRLPEISNDSLFGETGNRGRPRSVAIVGSRKNTVYGKEVAYKAAYEAAKAGAVVISGLAYGIDSVAHRGALDAGGVTVAVLGTPIDQIYPREHSGLAKEIIEKGGAVISEYGPGSSADSGTEIKTRFLARNRLIAALSDVVLITEAAARSGTLNTAMHALDNGVDLMATPGDITKLSSEGCNRLISQGAIPYLGPDGLLDLLFPGRLTKKRSRKKDLELEIEQQLAHFAETEVERKVLKQILTGVRDGDEIIEELGISAAEFGQTVTILEIKGAIKPLGMNQWVSGK